MAMLALGAIGSAIGAAAIPAGIMGISGATIGLMVGQMAAAALFPPEVPDQVGPRQTDLKIQTSSYGQAIPIVYGCARIAGNVIDGEDIRQTEHQEDIGGGKGGKGGGTRTTFTYSCTFAVAICEGEIKGIRRIWANNQLVYDGGATQVDQIVASLLSAGTIRIYPGSDTQMPDPSLQAIHGDLTPAYRGLAYIVFTDLQLEKFGNRVPNFEFEVVKEGSTSAHRIIDVGQLKTDQIGGSPYISGIFAVSSVATGGGGDYSTGMPMIIEHSGGSLRVMSNELTPTAPSANDRVYTIDYKGNFLSTEEKGTYEKLAHGDSPGPQRVFVGPWLGDPLYKYLAILRRYDASRIIGPNLGFVVRNSIDGETPLVIEGLEDEEGRYLVGAYLTKDSYSLYLFTAPDSTSGVDRWFKAQITSPLVGSVIDSGTCDFYGDGTDAPIPKTYLDGFGNSSHNGRLSGMLEEDGVHLWTCGSHAVFLLSMNKANKKFALEATLDYGSNPGGYVDPRSIWAEGGVAFAVGTSNYAQYTRIGAVETAPVQLGGIVADLCSRCGLESSDIDVSQLTDEVLGYVVGNRMTVRAAIQPLQSTFYFDGLESEGVIKFVKRGGPIVANIPEDDLAAHAPDSGEMPDQLTTIRAQDMELPTETTVSYFSINGDYANGSQYYRRQTSPAKNVATINLAIVLEDSKAAEVAAVNNVGVWQNRTSLNFATSRKYSHLEPCDLVTVSKGDIQWTVRITRRTDGADGVISFEGVLEDPHVYNQSAAAGATRPSGQKIALPASTYLQLLDLPALSDSMAEKPVIIGAAEGYTSEWEGAGLFASVDEGDSYTDTGIRFTRPSILGFTLNALAAPGSFGAFDSASTLDVRLVNPDATLSSANELSVLNGANAALVGDEIIQFKTATQLGIGSYRLTGLLRGRRGTEAAASAHQTNDRFVLLSPALLKPANVESSLIGKELFYKAPTNGMTLGATRPSSLVYKANNMKPLAPVYGLAYRDESPASWHLSWTRRTRSGGEWRDLVDVPLSESSEKYDVEIYTDATYTTLKRAYSNLTSSACLYSAADQIADFGSIRDNVFAIVYQRSELVGRGSGHKFSGSWSAPVVVGPPPTLEDLLLHFDGANGSTAFVDDGMHAATVSAFGSAQIVTSSAKFGASSASFDGSSAYLTVNSPAALNLGSSFCVDFWFKSTQTGRPNATFLSRPHDDPASGGVFLNGAWAIQFLDNSGNPNPIIYAADYNRFGPLLYSSIGSLANGVWHHLAWTFDGATYRMFIDGALAASQNSTVVISNTIDILSIGDDLTFGPRKFAGQLDEIRIRKGSAIYTAPFTPPTAPYA